MKKFLAILGVILIEVEKKIEYQPTKITLSEKF